MKAWKVCTKCLTATEMPILRRDCLICGGEMVLTPLVWPHDPDRRAELAAREAMIADAVVDELLAV